LRTSTQPYRYLSDVYDPTIKLHDFHARAYDASAGRFLTEDPVKGLAALPQTLNPYPCSVNNPLRYPDPSGMLGEGLADGAARAGAAGNDYYLNGRANKLPGTGGCAPPPTGSEGYTDLNLSLGYGVGATGGVQWDDRGNWYPYVGAGLMSPPGSASLTQGFWQSPSPGWNAGVQVSRGLVYNNGRAFGECAAGFEEVGGGLPPGISLTGYYIFTEEEVKELIANAYGRSDPRYPTPIYP
jgi:RHS repeat-associated protein